MKEEGGPPLAPPPAPPPPLWHAALSPDEQKREKRAQRPGRHTFYAVLPVGGAKGPASLASQLRPLPAFLPSFLAHFLF